MKRSLNGTSRAARRNDPRHQGGHGHRQRDERSDPLRIDQSVVAKRGAGGVARGDGGDHGGDGGLDQGVGLLREIGLRTGETARAAGARSGGEITAKAVDAMSQTRAGLQEDQRHHGRDRRLAFQTNLLALMRRSRRRARARPAAASPSSRARSASWRIARARRPATSLASSSRPTRRSCRASRWCVARARP